MSWSDKLRQGSFRGVPFQIRSHDAEFSRRYATHTYPQRDLPYQEDLGAAPEAWSIDGYVVGDDYAEQRDRLIEACQRSGAGGILVHPYLGLRIVVCKSLRVRESSRDGRMASIQMTFEQAGDEVVPVEARPLQSSAEGAGDAVGQAAEDLVVADLVVGSTSPDFVRDAAAAETVSIGERLRSLDVFSGPYREVAALQSEITALIGQASAIVTAPADLAARVRSAVKGVLASVSNAVDALAAYETLFAHSSGSSSGSSKFGVAADRNRDLLTGLLRKSAVGMSVQVAGSIAWDSFDAATERRDRITAMIDELLDDAEDATFAALTNLRAAAVSSIPPEGEDLPRLATFAVARTCPSLALSYRLHGSLEEEAGLISRNRIRNPARILGGSSLEVLIGGPAAR